MFAYTLRRLLLLIPTLFGILALTFAIIQFVPGGPVEQLAAQLSGANAAGEVAAVSNTGLEQGQKLSAEDMAKLNALYGFDKPALQRFWEMSLNFLRFDLGDSFFHHASVFELVKQKMPVSMSLGLWTFFLTYLICIP
ncbi:MAG: microcin ABC transporter permease, partial [Neisseria sp.]|nr:microcin ABC transporter permease [Neisseria sp.]